MHVSSPSSKVKENAGEKYYLKSSSVWNFF